jgi:hypothetical protein
VAGSRGGRRPGEDDEEGDGGRGARGEGGCARHR